MSRQDFFKVPDTAFKYLGHGNAGLVLLTRIDKTQKQKQLIKFIPCLTRTDCISMAGYEGLCTSSVASTNLPYFPSSPERILTLTPDEFKTHWSTLFQKQNYPLPKRWKQSDPEATWLNRNWHVLVIYSKEYLHDKIEKFKNRSFLDRIYILFSILAAVQSAQFHYQMIHGDLHIKNIMVRMHPNNDKRPKKLVFRKSTNMLYELDFGEMEYDVVLVDWEKSTSSKLFGYRSMHAHLQRMLPVFFKHHVNIVPCEWIDIDYIFNDLVPNLFQLKQEQELVSTMDVSRFVTNKNFMYSYGIYPVNFLYTMKDPTWICLLVQELVGKIKESLEIEIVKDATYITEMLPAFDKTPLPKWESTRDFFEHFMEEYFSYRKPMHQYILPPFSWEKRQFDMLRKDFFELKANTKKVDIRSWPTSIPRPILYADSKEKLKMQENKPGKYTQEIIKRQLQVMEIYFLSSPETRSESETELEREIKTEIHAIKSLSGSKG